MATLFAASSISAQSLVKEDFESYSPNSFVVGQCPPDAPIPSPTSGCWQTWNGVPGGGPGTPDALVVDTTGFAVSPGSHALAVEPGDDVLARFPVTEGSFTISADVYIPSGQSGEYTLHLLNTYEPLGVQIEATAVRFEDSTGVVQVAPSLWTGVAGPSPIVHDAWVELLVEVQLESTWSWVPGGCGGVPCPVPKSDVGTFSAYYNGVPIMVDGNWAHPDTAAALAALRFSATAPPGSMVYWDNISIECASCIDLPLIEVTCESDCSASSVDLSWGLYQSGGTPLGVEVARDGVIVATLPGSAFSYRDSMVPTGVQTYDLVATYPGGGSARATCSTFHCLNDTCVTAIPLQLQSVVTFDPTGAHAELGSPLITCGELAPFWGNEPDLWYSFLAPCSGDVTFDLSQSSYDTRMEVWFGGFGAVDCALVFDPVNLLGCNDDACLPAYLPDGPSRVDTATLVGGTYLVRISGWQGSGETGQLEVILSEVTGLVSFHDCASDSVILSWDSSSVTGAPLYDFYDVYRDGEPLVLHLLAGTEFFVDTNPTPGQHLYSVVGFSVNCEMHSRAAETAVAIPGPRFRDLIVRAESVGGAIDSVAALEAALSYLGLGVLVVDATQGFCNLNQNPWIERIYFLGGTYPSNGVFPPSLQADLVSAQAMGKSIYCEGGDLWAGFTPLDPTFAAIDGVEDLSSLDGDDSFTEMSGVNSGVGLDTSDLVGIPYLQDQPTNDSTDRIQASASDSLGPNSNLIWVNHDDNVPPLGPEPEYGTAVFYATNSGGKVLCQSWEFGGFGGDQIELATRYLAALSTSFIRGDDNRDGIMDIADPIYGLGYLFGTDPASCLDAQDTNDDGLVDISDPIYALSYLFSNGPPPPAPFPSCGPDLAGDSLDCGEYVCP